MLRSRVRCCLRAGTGLGCGHARLARKALGEVGEGGEPVLDRRPQLELALANPRNGGLGRGQPLLGLRQLGGVLARRGPQRLALALYLDALAKLLLRLLRRLGDPPLHVRALVGQSRLQLRARANLGLDRLPTLAQLALGHDQLLAALARLGACGVCRLLQLRELGLGGRAGGRLALSLGSGVLHEPGQALDRGPGVALAVREALHPLFQLEPFLVLALRLAPRRDQLSVETLDHPANLLFGSHERGHSLLELATLLALALGLLTRRLDLAAGALEVALQPLEVSPGLLLALGQAPLGLVDSPSAALQLGLELGQLALARLRLLGAGQLLGEPRLRLGPLLALALQCRLRLAHGLLERRYLLRRPGAHVPGGFLGLALRVRELRPHSFEGLLRVGPGA